VTRGLALIVIAALLSGCSKEARELGPTVPETPPAGDADPRIAFYQDNLYQVSQGQRYFSWYGCSACHNETSTGYAMLADGRWRYGGGFGHVFAAITERHGRFGYGARIPVEQLWQITAYVRDLPMHDPEKRRRVALDERSEPEGATWKGPQ
jgi:cytochrome c oxidase cbb3-type subunit 3